MATYPRVVPPSSPSQVDPAVLRLLAPSRAVLLGKQAELVLAVHQRLLELVPVIARMPGSGRSMCWRLVAVMLQAADGDLPPAQAAAIVAQAGADNHWEGFPDPQHDTVTHVLLREVRANYDGEWSSGLSSAWVAYLIWLRAYLAAGAEAQRVFRAAHEAALAADPSLDNVAGPPAAATQMGTTAIDQFGVPSRPEAEPSLPPAATLDDVDDDDEPGYGSLMMSMTLGRGRGPRGG